MQQFSNEGVGDHLPCPGRSITASGGEWEIQEVVEEPQASAATRSMSMAAAENGDDVYVAVGKSSSSMEALSWALRHVATPSSLVYLIHVFPEVHHIPTPLGMLPKNQVTPQQVETYMDQERNKRRELLQKFLSLCAASKVQADTLLIESDLIAKAISDLIPVLHIKKLFIGTTKSNLRKGKLKKGNGKAQQIYYSAPQYCEVKIICQGKEAKATKRLSDSSVSINSNSIKENANGRKNRNSIQCICFSRKFM